MLKKTAFVKLTQLAEENRMYWRDVLIVALENKIPLYHRLISGWQECPWGSLERLYEGEDEVTTDLFMKNQKGEWGSVEIIEQGPKQRTNVRTINKLTLNKNKLHLRRSDLPQIEATENVDYSMTEMLQLLTVDGFLDSPTKQDKGGFEVFRKKITEQFIPAIQAGISLYKEWEANKTIFVKSDIENRFDQKLPQLVINDIYKALPDECKHGKPGRKKTKD